MEVIAHRGESGAAPENTLPAFERALRCGADGVEFDVQASQDGVPVVIHDERLERTTNGTGWVGEQTWDQLQALDAGSWFGAGFAGARLPRLAEVLSLFRGSGMTIHVELKTDRVPYAGLVRRVVDLVRDLGVAGQVLLSSFNHNSLGEVHALAPHLPRAALLSNALLEPWDYATRHGFQALHVRDGMVDAPLVEGCHRQGLALRAYTVDDVAEARRLAGLGLDGVFTNHPARILARSA
ncbi:MAG TPA: glycerophosphodiester phosphodiesterase [bacterium]|nr:glycerophosphodiester phosphodiesterase [bacterium]